MTASCTNCNSASTNEAIASGADSLAQRHEELLKLELAPREFIAYAHGAIEGLTAYLEEHTSEE